MTKAELERRVADLEAELAWRRSHVCAAVPSCTCMSAAAPGILPCAVHGSVSRVFTTTLRPGKNLCGGAAYNVWQTQVINNAGAYPVARFDLQLSPAVNACAGGGASHYWVTVP